MLPVLGYCNNAGMYCPRLKLVCSRNVLGSDKDAGTCTFRIKHTVGMKISVHSKIVTSMK